MTNTESRTATPAPRVTSWTWLRSFVKEQEAIDLHGLSRGALVAMSNRLNEVIQAQFLPPIFTFLRLCRLHDRVCSYRMATAVDYHADKATGA